MSPRSGNPATQAAVRPPVFAQLLLKLCLPPGSTREFVLGDFWEDYLHLRRAASPLRARFWYWRESLGVSARAVVRRVKRSEASSPASAGGSGPAQAPSPRRGFVARLAAMITQDFPYGVRNLAKAPGFTAVAVLSLALGIAPLTAIGGFINAMFFRPLPHVQEQDQLVALFRGVSGPISWPDLADAGAEVDAFEDVAGFRVYTEFNLTDDEVTTTLMGSSVSPNYFDVLRVPLAIGRGFSAAEMGADAPLVAVVSHTFWRDRFGPDNPVLGVTIRLDGRDYTIIGVAPEGLLSPERPVEPAVYVPLRPEHADNRGRLALFGAGRLREGATLEEARVQLGVLQERLIEAYPRYWSSEPGQGGNYAAYPVIALRVQPGMLAQITVAVALVTILGLLVLATACSNLGNLLLARGSRRGSEIAVRLAMGADRSTLVTMLLSESVLLGCAGGAIGALVAHWLTQALAAGLLGPGLGIDFTLDLRVLAFTAFVSIATGVLFGLIPALRASRPDLSSALKGEQAAFGRNRMLSFRNFLVVGQIAASLALLVSAAVLVRSVQVAQSTDPGFDPEGIIAVSIDLTQGSYSDDEGKQFFRDLTSRIAAAPDVEGVALAVDLPLDGGRWLNDIVPEGIELGEGEQILVDENRVSGNYFELLRTPILRGRTFNDADTSGSAPVVVVNEELAERFWPDGAIGRTLALGDGGTVQIVGVVRNAKYGRLAESPTLPHLWRPNTQAYSPSAYLVVRARSDARAVIPAVRRLVREMDPNLPVLEPRLMTDLVAWSGEDQRVVSILLSIVGMIALTLAVVGIYGVISFLVSQRTHEVGLRVALGARRADVIGMVLGQGMRLVVAGVAVGLLMGFGIAQLLAATFPGVELSDPVAPGLATLILAAAAVLAILMPALRASRVDPMVALRAE